MTAARDTDITGRGVVGPQAPGQRAVAGAAGTDPEGLAATLDAVRACRLCADLSGLEPRPVLRMAPAARLLIIGQAPGARVHASGLPWDDPSGDRLRAWLQMTPARFYDPQQVAIIPSGLCFPGQDSKGGDKPPPALCAKQWHGRLLRFLPAVELVLLVGSHAQARYLARPGKALPPLASGHRLFRGLPAASASMTGTVRHAADFLPGCLPLPHPSWRNNHWIAKNPWFDAEILPLLRQRLHVLFAGTEAIVNPEQLESSCDDAFTVKRTVRVKRVSQSDRV